MKKLVVAGNGMAGVACVEQILKYRHDFEISIFGDETHVNYNRILLSSVLAGEKSADEIVLNDIDWYQANGIVPRLGQRLTAVDSERQVVTAADGSETAFDRLIIATGSSALVPPIPGVDKKNVFVFRTLDDTRALLERSRPGCRAVVIGGGLLGLEAARGLQVQGCDVTVVHLAQTLDGAAARSHGGRLSHAQDGEPRRARSAGAADSGASRQRPCGGSALRRWRGAAGRSGGDRRGHPAQRRPRPDGWRRGTARHRRERPHGDVEPEHLRRGRMHGASRSALRAGGSAFGTGQGAGGHHHRQSRTCVYGRDTGRKAEDHGRGCILRGQHVGGRSRCRDCAVRGRLTRHLQEAAHQGQPAARRDPRRRYVR